MLLSLETELFRLQTKLFANFLAKYLWSKSKTFMHCIHCFINICANLICCFFCRAQQDATTILSEQNEVDHLFSILGIDWTRGYLLVWRHNHAGQRTVFPSHLLRRSITQIARKCFLFKWLRSPLRAPCITPCYRRKIVYHGNKLPDFFLAIG